jgi:hypothetical protein
MGRIRPCELPLTNGGVWGALPPDADYYPRVGMATGISCLPPSRGPSILPEPGAFVRTNPMKNLEIMLRE